MIQILDCTLRDGGYYNNWNFDVSLINKYINTVSNLPIRAVEIGYLSNANDEKGTFYHLDANILKIFKKKLKNHQELFVMVNLKEFKSYNVLNSLIEKNCNYLDGVRFALNPNDLNKYHKWLLKIKRNYKNLKFCINLMYASTWLDKPEQAKKLFIKAKSCSDFVNIVDSYGSLTPENLDDSLKKLKNIDVIFDGVHFHNNCNFALANTVISIKNGINKVDTTFAGMGRGAGNAETELLLAYTKAKILNNFSLNELIEKFNQIKKEFNWGASYPYAFSAMNGFPQSEMMNLIQNKRVDHVDAINLIKTINLPNNELRINENTKNSFLKIKQIKKLRIFILGGGEDLKSLGPFFLSKLKKNDLLILSSNKALKNLIAAYSYYRFSNSIALILTGDEIHKINLTSKILKKLNIKYLILEKKPDELKKNFFLRKKKIFFSNSTVANPVLVAGIFLKYLNYRDLNLAFFDGGKKLIYGMDETLKSIKYLKSIGFKINLYTKSYIKGKIKNINSDD